MNEQFCVDWINSLDIPGSVFIDKIEDLFNDNNVLLNIISIILNKKEEELLYILDDLKSLNYIENIANLMNLYFDYNYDYKNTDYLVENTILLLEFLKSRYPKNPINQKADTKQNFSKNVFNSNDYNNNDYINLKDINNGNNNNSNQGNNNKTRIKNNNINNKDRMIKSKKDIGKFEPKNNLIIDCPTYNYKTAPNRSISSDKIIKNKITNTSNNNNSNSNIINNNNQKKDSFYKEITIITNNLKRQSKNKSEYLSPILKSEDFKNSKSLSSNIFSKAKRKIKTNNNNKTSDNFIKKVMTSKIPNYFLMTIGKPILKKDDSFYYYQFQKISFPVTHISIEPKNAFKRNKKNYYKFPFLLQNLMNEKNIKKYKEKNLTEKNNNKYRTVNNMNENEKKEKLILDYLNKLGIINTEQKNSEYLWKILIPDLKDGYIIGKLINLLERKNRNYLKGISKETFYKVNIYFNWQKIIEFLINRNKFNSIYLYQKNFYSNDNKLFNFLYDLIKFYYDKENINKSFRQKNQKYNIDISNIKNISDHNLPDNNINYSKNSYLDKSNQNKSYNSTPIQPKKRKKQINNSQSKNLKLNSTPSISEIMNIRKSLNYIHRENNSLMIFSNKEKKNSKNNLNKSEDFINLKNKNKTEKIYVKGENLSFDKNVDNILSFLKLIGVNISQINFYTSEMKIFKDGILLYQIISQLENNLSILPKIDLNPKSPSNAINNHRLIINFLNKYKKNFPIELTEKEKELYKANPIFILKFLNVLKSVYNNEIYYLEKINKIKYNENYRGAVKQNSKINPKNIDKSERLTIPLNQELRNKFLVKENAQIWA